MKSDNMMPRKEALKSLIRSMKMMQLEKIKGFNKASDDEPAMIIKMKEKESPEEDSMDPEEDKEDEELE